METTTLPVDLSQLTAEQKNQLMKELAAEEANKKQRIKAERDNYKSLVHETVTNLFPTLVELSSTIRETKEFVFGELETIKRLKSELYGVKENQQSDTFTSNDGKISIKLGYRVTENFDDTLHAGVEKVKSYLATLAKDQDSAALVETIMDLLKKDAKGNLKANRVLELRKLANRVNNEEFSDGIRIIEESYRPNRSCNFIEARFKDDNGTEHSLPLSISAFGLDIDNSVETSRELSEENTIDEQ